MLLDTHIWVWGAEGDTRRIGPRTRRAIDRSRERGGLHVSTASILEMAALQAAGRIELTTSVENWVRASIEAGALRVLEVYRGDRA